MTEKNKYLSDQGMNIFPILSFYFMSSRPLIARKKQKKY